MRKPRLGEALILEGVIQRHQLREALALQQRFGGQLGTNLLELGILSEERLLKALGRLHRAPTVARWDLENIPTSVVKLVPSKLATRYRIVPFRLRGRTLSIASLNGGDVLVEDEIGLLTSCLVRSYVGLEVRIAEALERYYGYRRPVRLTALAERLGPATETRPGLASEPMLPELDLRALRDTSAGRTADVRETAEQRQEIAGATVTPPRQVPVPRIPEAPEAPVAPLEPSEAEELRALQSLEHSVPPEERLEAAAAALQKTEIRDEIADVLTTFCAPYFRRRLLLISRRDRIVGWRGEGEGIEPEGIRSLGIPVDEPSVFLGLSRASSFWVGPLAQLPSNDLLIEAIGGVAPKECVILPLPLRDKIVGFLYGDNLESGVQNAPLPEMRRLLGKAGIAFEVCILRNKIRTL